jgi:hypothetical protein
MRLVNLIIVFNLFTIVIYKILFICLILKYII